MKGAAMKKPKGGTGFKSPKGMKGDITTNPKGIGKKMDK